MLRSSLAALAIAAAIPAAADPLDGVWHIHMHRTRGICETNNLDYAVAIRDGTMRYLPDPGDVVPEFNGRVSQSGRVAVWARRGLAEVRGTGELNGRSGSGIWQASLLGCAGDWTARKT